MFRQHQSEFHDEHCKKLQDFVTKRRFLFKKQILLAKLEWDENEERTLFFPPE